MTKELVKRDEDDAEYGPAMAALQPKQRAFVMNLFTGSSRNGRYSEAYLKAGYVNSNPETTAACASRLLHNERVQLAISEVTRKAASSLAPEALHALTEILADPMHKDRARVATALVERAAPSIQQIAVSHTHEIVDKRVEEINALQIQRDKLGASREALIATWGAQGLARIEANERASKPVIEDGSFVEVTEEQELW
jgi:hypothetical protein